jgi:hypothetical protein
LAEGKFQLNVGIAGRQASILLAYRAQEIFEVCADKNFGDTSLNLRRGALRRSSLTGMSTLQLQICGFTEKTWRS